MTAIAAGVLLLLVCTAVPSQRVPDARLLLYPYGVLIQIPAMVLSLFMARRCSGSVRVQWTLMAFHFLFRSLAFLGPALYVWGHMSNRYSSWSVVAGSSIANIFSLIALTAFLIPGGNKRKRTLDIVMVSMLAFVQFMLMVSTGPDGFSAYHLEISVATSVFMLGMSVMCLLGAATPRHAAFHRVVVLYYAAHLITIVCCNWAFYRWMLPSQENFVNFTYGLGPVVFALLALRELTRTSSPAEGFTHSLFRNIPASVVAMTGATLVPLALYGHPLLSSALVMVMVACLVLRTHLSYQRMFRDRLELESRAVYMENLATEDTLTGVGNRRRLQREVERNLLHFPESPIALLLFDIDHFKQINDTGGHQTGDQLLKDVAAIASRSVSSRPAAGCFRIGGDEFAVFLPGVQESDALGIANNILSQTRARNASVSIGVIVSPHAAQLNFLLEAADVALYRAKGGGRNRVITVAPSVLDDIIAGHHDTRRRFREA